MIQKAIIKQADIFVFSNVIKEFKIKVLSFEKIYDRVFYLLESTTDNFELFKKEYRKIFNRSILLITKTN